MDKTTRTILLAVGGFLVVGFLLRRQAVAAVEAVANVNQATPFEGAGIIGTAGNLANQASGGFLAETGSTIGLFLSDIFDRRTVDDLTGG